MSRILLASLLVERLRYTPPKINLLKTGDTTASKRIFYDFYAMEYLHRILGTPLPMSTGAKVHAAKTDPNFGAGFAAGTNWDDVEYPMMGGKIAPHKLRVIIDDVFEQVTKILGTKLSGYLRMALVQELRHIFNKSHQWLSFRNTIYLEKQPNKTTISKERFNKLVKTYLPSMTGQEESVKRLLKFSALYDNNYVGTGDVPEPEEPEKEPDATDDLDKIEPKPDNEYKPEEDPELSDAEPTDDTEDDYWKKYDPFWDSESTNENFINEICLLTEDDYSVGGQISSKVVAKINHAINNSKLTWKDIENAYSKIAWSESSYGGPAWGTGATAFIKLMPELQSHNYEKISAAIDHIYDLAHNSGPMLNKGGLFIPQRDLDRRARVTHVARYLEDVSPVIKQLINRCLVYLPGNPEDERKMEEYINSPAIHATPEQKKILDSLDFNTMDGTNYSASVKYKNKDNQIKILKYNLKIHENNIITINTDDDSDAQVFHDFNEAIEKFKKEHGDNITKLPRYTMYAARRAVTDFTKEQKLKFLTINIRPSDFERLEFANFNVVDTDGNAEPKMLTAAAFTDGTYAIGIRYDMAYIETFNNFDDLFKRCSEKNTELKFHTLTPTQIHNADYSLNPPPPSTPILTQKASPDQHTKGHYDVNGNWDPYYGGNTYASNIYGGTTSTTAQMYTKKPSVIPPNSTSSSDYTLHVGLNTPPKSIRLTDGDEMGMVSRGFEVLNNGGITYYKHRKNNDTVTFFNNDKSVLVSAQFAGIKLSKPINDMTQYIADNYDDNGFIGKTPVPTNKQSTGKVGGKKLSPTNEQYLTEKGFIWNTSNNKYHNKINSDSILINPNFSVRIDFKSGSVKHLPTLTSLLNYIINDYDATYMGAYGNDDLQMAS